MIPKVKGILKPTLVFKIFNMKRENIESSWIEISEKLINRFPKLRKINMDFIKGKEEELLSRIEMRLDKSRAELLTLIDTL